MFGQWKNGYHLGLQTARADIGYAMDISRAMTLYEPRTRAYREGFQEAIVTVFNEEVDRELGPETV